MVAEVVADWEAKQVKPKQGECVVMLLPSSLGQLRPQILMCGQVFAQVQKHFFLADLCSYHHQCTNIKSLFVISLNLVEIWLNTSRWKFEIREPTTMRHVIGGQMSVLPGPVYATRDLKSTILVEVLLSRCPAHFLASSSHPSPHLTLTSPLSPRGGDYTIHVLLQLISPFLAIPMLLPSHLIFGLCFVSTLQWT